MLRGPGGGVSSGRDATAPCFLVGPATIALPASSPKAAGLDVTPGTLPAALRREPLRCLACADDSPLDFGPVAELGDKLRGR